MYGVATRDAAYALAECITSVAYFFSRVKCVCHYQCRCRSCGIRVCQLFIYFLIIIIDYYKLIIHVKIIRIEICLNFVVRVLLF